MPSNRTTRIKDPVLGRALGEDEQIKGGVRYYWDSGQKKVMAQEPGGTPFQPLYDDLPLKLKGRMCPYG